MLAALPQVALSTHNKFCKGGGKFAKFIHKSEQFGGFEPPLTGVKRELTFYDLKCEFYR